MDDSYRKTYRLRLAQSKDTKSIEVTFPYEVIDKEARKHGLTVQEFISQYQVVAQFNGFDGVLYNFQPIQRNGGK